VSARTARRGAGKCRWCLARDGHIEPPDDDDRRFWLQTFSDDELVELATIIFCRPGSLRRIRAERERLLGRVGVAACSPSSRCCSCSRGIGVRGRSPHRLFAEVILAKTEMPASIIESPTDRVSGECDSKTPS
jgi:hypothetical protein